MPLSSKPFSEWNKEDLNALLTDPPAEETSQLDFKAECNLLSDKPELRNKARRDTLIDIASMANGEGGALILGVKQSQDPSSTPHATEIIGIQDPQRIIKTIEDLVSSHLRIRPSALEYNVISCEGNVSVVVVDVPKNTYSLTMVAFDNLNQFWIRRDVSNRLMSIDEIQYRFSRFHTVEASAEEELARIRTIGLPKSQRPFVWFSGVPVDRSIDHIPVKVDQIKKLLDESSYFVDFPQAPGNCAPRQLADVLSPSLHGISISREYDVQERRYLEVRRDGTVVFSVCVAGLKNDTVSLSGIYETLASGLCLFADVQNQFQVGKAAIVQAGFKNCGNLPVVDPRLVYAPKLPPADDIVLKMVQVSEPWKPKEVFLAWATQLANALEIEQPIQRSPWI
ncbi:MAG: ATP-binding protein [Phycisphaerae bacterium]|jgi:hypothetical protein